MPHSGPLESAEMQRAILEAKLAIKEHFLSLVVTDIYEDTGQQLSAVRVQLALLEHAASADLTAGIRETGQLVSKMIATLRTKSAGFSNDAPTHPGKHFSEVLIAECRRFDEHNHVPVTITGTRFHLTENIGVLLFASALRILGLLKSNAARMVEVAIEYTKKQLRIAFVYDGMRISIKELRRTITGPFHITYNRNLSSNHHFISLTSDNVPAE